MGFLIADSDSKLLDATVEIEPNAIVLHSRGGTIGSPNARNVDYAKALRLILARLKSSPIGIKRILIDSSRVRNLDAEQRVIFSAEDSETSPERIFTLLSRRMQAVGRDATSRGGRGNSNKRIRIELTSGSVGQIANYLNAHGIHQERLSWDRISEAASILAASILQTVNAADGRLQERRSKEKCTDMDRAQLEDHIAELITQQDGRCAISGIVFELPAEALDSDMKASPDRIDSDQGYIRGNIQIVCWFINRWKNDDNDANFRRLLQKVKETQT